MKHTQEFYTCKRLRLLQYLLEKGFEPATTVPDPSNYRYNMWLFKNTESLQQTVEEYFNNLLNK